MDGLKVEEVGDVTISKKDLIAICDPYGGWKEYNNSDYGRHLYSCAYCGADDAKSEIKHKLDCPVLVAQDLMTGLA